MAEEPKKPGTTRLAFIALPAFIAILAAVIGVYIAFAPVSMMERMAYSAMDAVLIGLGAVLNHYFGNKA